MPYKFNVFTGKLDYFSTGSSGTGDVVGPASATDNAVARFDTTTGKLIQNSVVTISDTGEVDGVFSELIGSTANTTDFPSAKLVASTADTGEAHIYNIGVVGEAKADIADTSIWGVGVYGAGATNGLTRSAGLMGDGLVTNTLDSGSAIGVRGYANQVHAGGMNIGLYADAVNSSIGNYALYMNTGNIIGIQPQTWTLNDNNANALSFDTSGKSGILNIVTTDGSEGITMSGTLGVTGAVSGSNLSGTNTGDSSGHTGLVPYTGATGAIDIGANNLTVDTNTLFVDATNNRIGVGTITPAYEIDNVGTTRSKLFSSYLFSLGQSGAWTSGFNAETPKNYFNLGADWHGSAIYSSNVYLVDDALKIANTHPTISGTVLKIPGNGKTNQGAFVFYTTPPGSVVANAAYAGTQRLLIASNGNIAIGTNTAPSAYLHIKAGTATAGTAPIKLTSGTVNTTPEAGAIEFDGTDYWLSI